MSRSLHWFISFNERNQDSGTCRTVNFADIFLVCFALFPILRLSSGCLGRIRKPEYYPKKAEKKKDILIRSGWQLGQDDWSYYQENGTDNITKRMEPEIMWDSEVLPWCTRHPLIKILLVCGSHNISVFYWWLFQSGPLRGQETGATSIFRGS